MRETLYSIQVNRMLYQFLQTFKIFQSDIVIGQLKTSSSLMLQHFINYFWIKIWDSMSMLTMLMSSGLH